MNIFLEMLSDLLVSEPFREVIYFIVIFFTTTSLKRTLGDIEVIILLLSHALSNILNVLVNDINIKLFVIMSDRTEKIILTDGAV